MPVLTIETDTLHVLATAVALLQQNGVSKYDANALWSMTDVPGVSIPINSEHTPSFIIRSAQTAIHQLEAVQRALHLLECSSKERLRAVKAHLRPYLRTYGINSLPDDVLATIFEILRAEDDSLVPAFSQVCQRFRDLSLGLPLLWSSISLAMPSCWIDLLLERSENVGLSIDMEGIDQPGTMNTFLSQLVPHAGRWRHVKNLGARNMLYLEKLNKKLREQWGALHLPALQSFELDIDKFENPRAAVDFYETWHMPKLRHLSTSRHIPPPHTFPNFRTLTSFSFHQEYGTDMLNLANFLGSLDNLTDLNLELDIYNNNSWQIAETELPSLRNLKLSVWGPVELRFVTDTMRMPVLKCLSLQMTLSPEECILLLASIASRTVEELNIIQYYGSGHGRLETSALFKYFPCLKRFTVDAPDTYLSFEGILELPPLRTVRLSAIPEMDAALRIAQLRKLLGAQGKWKEFEVLEICEGDWLTREQAEKVFSKEKLRWIGRAKM
ncbi:hypothetical protein EW145_g6004 [Phellinidium pouzarii]|uniref:F-box domain-containing protein n=1 Tax=Phellinidium pouzarii TaxID=167371 RepID=A0A4S4KZV2_9AGAM|nr:hypothetical protein EW145_g6004 [Phellinidium pouzarii]